SEHFEEKGDPVISLYEARKGRDASHKVRDVFPDMIFGGELYRDDCNKVSFILNSYQDHLDSIEEFPDLKPGTWGGSGEIALFGDLGVKDIDKGHAIDVLLEHLGASIEDTFAFGDAKVDIPMLEKCAVGVAVANGGDEIKAMADYVTDAVDDDGIYNAFKHFHLI
ncbi:MAG: HAD hydrolase family protein, partial [bacterium]